MPINTHAMYSYGDRVNQLFAAQAIEYCPYRANDLLSMCQGLPAFLMDAAQELHEARQSMDAEAKIGRRAYLYDLDTKILAVINRHQPITIAEIKEIMPAESGEIFERLKVLGRQRNISYSRHKPDDGWSIADDNGRQSDI